ncbi:MAG: ABC-F family ATP-binding cassette domain-containing protein [Deltaproteobacteria bacterium]|nr:ABC-F family ATP-binding cassette domain-containing protein [Deltaproteobacteria bacterium]
MLQLTRLSKQFGSRKVLDEVSLMVQGRDRLGLVGMNGSGKSTLMKIMAGIVAPDDGDRSIGRSETAGYLPQDGLEAGGRTLLREVTDACPQVRACEAAVRDIEGKLEGGAAGDPGHEDLLRRYGDHQAEFQRLGGYDLEARAQAILLGLGFASGDFERDTRTYSGGWQMRIALAKLLLLRPTVLLLDEPTNHLDLEARNWLEAFLADYPGAVVVVSHDRYFMDVTIDHIVEISGGKLSVYHTDYSRFEQERENRRLVAWEAYRKQREEIERIQMFINRFRYQASKAALVQSRVKYLEKLERVEPPEGREQIHFRFPQPKKSGRTVLTLEGASKRYGDLEVYRQVDFMLERGIKAALVGPNGAGKSTLLKMLAGVEPLTDGVHKLGHIVEIDYFAQDQSRTLDPDRTVLETMTEGAPLDIVPQLRTILGSFLFRGDDVNKRVAVLSGGERNRLALALMLLRPANVLLLDEPTNHLDLEAKDVLLEALLTYSGTVLFVSHDRHFLNRLSQHVFEVGQGEIHHYPGNYEDFLERKARDAAAEGSSPARAGKAARKKVKKEDAGEATTGGAAPAGGTAKEARIRARESEKAEARKEARHNRDLEKLEGRIGQAEKRLAEIEARLADPGLYEDPAGFEATLSEYQALKGERDRLYDRYQWMDEGRGGEAPG